ncbi:hypothetical protein Pan216_39850 [Planctomycetes bacterium Pan216]|uniref:Glycosyltransferase RgtA/B/C/D-like domain-containing protein n=1 Tax=Kolteria novifilia TaxID=2527975 RepID=A0A518B806_9BACT|nr:hypothetical protein Pan216_39850 [Planctomycetes bacterium Pan216]
MTATADAPPRRPSLTWISLTQGNEMTEEPGKPTYPWWMTLALFLLTALVAGATVAGPGISWDEPAYRDSQIGLQNWFGEMVQGDVSLATSFSSESIDHYWVFNRFGSNFHPPMASYLHLLTYWPMHNIWDDISSRRLAGAIEFALVVAMLGHWVGRTYGWPAGLFAALSLATLPRLLGHAHVIGTDMALLLFWITTAWLFLGALARRSLQWLFATSLACLFLVKASGVVVLVPVILWFGITVVARSPWRMLGRWLLWTSLIAAPLVPLGYSLLAGPDRLGIPPSWQRGFLLGPLMALVFFWSSQRRSRKAWNIALELPWMTMAVTPLVVIALNPTWWHDTIPKFASYVDLNLHRQDHLPPIAIFYLGEQYNYSLPWHNAFVLMAVTIPFGTLALGLAGVVRGFLHARVDLLPIYFFLQMMTLPLFRMLPTPAHDGVRLFLPTFFFFAAFAGLGATWLADRVARRHIAWMLLLLIGPGWAAVDWVRIHPYELSYYNVGLRGAMDWGLEPTYWYDAVTPAILDDVNHDLPENATVLVHLDPLINPEVFFELQSLGRLRGDIQLNPNPIEGFAWAWLLTHSSKATAFTRLLYACEPWYESGPSGVRLFSVVDPNALALAWAIHVFAVDEDRATKGGQLILNEAAFSGDGESLARAADLINQHREQAIEHLDDESAATRSLVKRVIVGGTLHPNVTRILDHAPWALDEATRILATRPQDVRRVLTYPGYLLPERFGGYLQPRPETMSRESTDD